MGRKLNDIVDADVQEIIEKVSNAFESSGVSLQNAINYDAASGVQVWGSVIKDINSSIEKRLEKDLQNRNGPVAKHLKMLTRINDAYMKTINSNSIYITTGPRNISHESDIIETLSPRVYYSTVSKSDWYNILSPYFRMHYILDDNTEILTSDWYTPAYIDTSIGDIKLQRVNNGRRPKYNIVFRDVQTNGCIVVTNIAELCNDIVSRPIQPHVFVEHDQLEDASYIGTPAMINSDKLPSQLRELMIRAGYDKEKISKLSKFTWREAKIELDEYFKSIEQSDFSGNWQLTTFLLGPGLGSKITINGTYGDFTNMEYESSNCRTEYVTRNTNDEMYAEACLFTDENKYRSINNFNSTRVILDGFSLRYIVDQIKKQSEHSRLTLFKKFA